MDDCKKKTRVRPLAFLAAVLAMASLAACDPAPRIELARMKGTQTTTAGSYSYFVPPYSLYYFHNMDKLGFQLDWVRRAGPLFPLQEIDAAQPAFSVTYNWQGRDYTLDQYLQRNNVLGFVVLKDTRIVAERYFHGAGRASRFLSNSVGKSMTSTLVGVALEEGRIESLTDPVTKYLPALADSGYNRVNLQQVLEMATGIASSENPEDPNSTIHAFNEMVISGRPSFSDYLRSLQPVPGVVPGTVFDYESVNTEVLGLVLEKATGVPLNLYMQDKLWSKIGAESDGFLYRARAQTDQCAFGCFSATARDYARFGLMAMNGGTLGGQRVVGERWMREATTPRPLRMPADDKGTGYGYQWWIPAGRDGAFEALGIFGQIVYVNPAKRVVVVQNAAWPEADADARWDEAGRVIDAIVARLSP
ncbi:MAG: serine hydrolase [Reyranella sp.]|nr:serine hydrolase [Reyranella sp.]MBL6653224.1 serine hydrolase [Reyranella sp.]